MKTEQIKQLKQGHPIVGTMVRAVRNPVIANLAKNGGLDFIMFDMEHGPFTLETIADAFKVARAVGLGRFVRIPELSKGYVSRIMDCGANGIMVPMLETARQAEQLVQWTKYPPLGKRGFGSSGGHTGFIGVSNRTVDFMEEANDETLSIAQIETGTAIENVDTIAAVEGLDALLIGPNDLSISLGYPGDFFNDEVQTAIRKAADAAAEHGKIFGMHSGDALLQEWIPRGVTLIMNNLDLNILSAGLKTIAEKYKQ